MSEDVWTPDRMPDLSGRTAVVTGANSGLGLETTLALARAGAAVVMACRDPRRAGDALDRVQREVPAAGDRVRARQLDLADLASVASFSDELAGDHDRLDLLVNNAGVMATPRRETADGFELQLGTNHLGHFALTGRLWPLLRVGGAGVQESRVVTVSSLAHRGGRLDRDDLMWRRSYHRWPAYSRSKLANLLFTRELARRVGAHGAPVRVLAAHPGVAATNLMGSAGPTMGLPKLLGRVSTLLTSLVAAPATLGSWPLLRAATDPEAESGDYYGPTGRGGTRGGAAKVLAEPKAYDDADAGWLWERSVELTGVTYADLDEASA